MEFKITGLSDNLCKDERFSLKQRNEGDQNNETQWVEETVFRYFQSKGISLEYSGDFPCLNVGKGNRSTYLPIEVCNILPRQRYTKSLSTEQRSMLVEKSRQTPAQRKEILERGMEINDYNSDPVVRACNINIGSQFVALQGRVLPPPELKFGEHEVTSVRRETPKNGRWNFNRKTMFRGAKIKKWIIVNFSIPRFTNYQISDLARELQRCCNTKGMEMHDYSAIVEETRANRDLNPADRVKAMTSCIKNQRSPLFILCLLPERKTSDLYGPWKKMCLEHGVVNQCLSPISGKVTDQYLTNVALKINAKMGGLNTVLNREIERTIPKISRTPTMIIGMDVSRGSRGNIDSPSIAAVVSSRDWPFISEYKACVKLQSPRSEMIEELYKQSFTTEGKEKDSGIMNELLNDFYRTSHCRRPEQMIIFRDGVGESQFDMVLNVELKAVLKACDSFQRGFRPRVTLIVAQKNHHTKLFPTNGQGNVEPGTIVDSHIGHPRNFDFYLCPQSGKMGTSRPTHHHVLLDEIGFTVDELQSVVHDLSYVYQRSTMTISSVAPINYAHLTAAQMHKILPPEDRRDGNALQLPVPHPKVCNTMYFC